MAGRIPGSITADIHSVKNVMATRNRLNQNMVAGDESRKIGAP
jgi:hypothetical protein